MSDQIRLRSGRYVYANNGILGVDANLQLYQGYDGSIWDTDAENASNTRPITEYEKIEIAKLAVDRWLRLLSNLTKDDSFSIIADKIMHERLDRLVDDHMRGWGNENR